MSDKPSPPSAGASAKAPLKSTPAYISSSGQTLNSLPITARLNRAADTIYNFLGLYFVSLLSLDPYAAAQNSRFNTRGPGRNTNAGASTGNAPRQGSGLFGGGRLGGGGGGGSGPSGGSGGGRRMGTVNDVRAPECGSCG